MKLNLGCGRDYRKGWQNCDISHEVQADDYFDLQEGLPYKDKTVDEIYASGVLEQICLNEKFKLVMNECWRVLQPQGIFTIIVPCARYAIAFRDPFDCRRFIEETWQYLDHRDEYYKKYGKVYGFMPWKVIKIEVNQRGIMQVILEKCELQ